MFTLNADEKESDVHRVKREARVRSTCRNSVRAAPLTMAFFLYGRQLLTDVGGALANTGCAGVYPIPARSSRRPADAYTADPPGIGGVANMRNGYNWLRGAT